MITDVGVDCNHKKQVHCTRGHVSQDGVHFWDLVAVVEPATGTSQFIDYGWQKNDFLEKYKQFRAGRWEMQHETPCIDIDS